MTGEILVVDDDPSILFTVKTLLDSPDMKVYTTDSGMDCLDRLAWGFKGLILMDIMMPELNGWDTIMSIIQAGLDRDNKICVFSAMDEGSLKQNPLNTHVAGYLQKPFDAETLFRTIEKHLV